MGADPLGPGRGAGRGAGLGAGGASPAAGFAAAGFAAPGRAEGAGRAGDSDFAAGAGRADEAGRTEADAAELEAAIWRAGAALGAEFADSLFARASEAGASNGTC